MIKSQISNILTKLPENNRLERIWLLAKMDFKRRYYGSFLGLIWAFINPLGRFFIYYFVFTYLIGSKTPNFALFLFLGLIFWIYFSESAFRGLNIIQTRSFILENIQINKIDIYFASLLSSTIGFAFNFTVYFVASIFFGVDINFTVVLFPLLFINMAIFILGTMIMLSVIHIFIRDIIHIWNLFVLMLMWFSGVFFQIDNNSADWKEAALAYLTPVCGIIKNTRAVLIYGEGFDLNLFIYDYVYALIFFFIALYFLNRSYGMALEKQ
ncbi:ABC transporter permease [Flavilitoribacter nigricans]|nr:ABC transporter permease [Flavilitoribacter nigricans]